MKKRRNKRNLIALICFCIFNVILLCANSSFAKEKPTSKIPVTLKILDVTTPITNTFTYQVIPSDDNPGTDKQKPITVNIDLKNEKPNENNIIQKQVNIDFKNFEYSQSGIYRYNVSEISNKNEKVFPKNKDKYEITVQVFETKDGYEVYALTPVAKISEKTKVEEVIFTNIFNTASITIKNFYTGKIANKEDYFKYELWIDGNIGDTFNIIGQDEFVLYDGRRIKTVNEYTITEKGSCVYIYLKDNQVATIGITSEGEDALNQIPIGTKFRIIQLDSRKVTTTINGDMRKEICGTVDNANITINILNERDYDIAITGIFFKIYPFIILIAVAIINILVIKVKKDVNYEDFE